MTGAWMAPLALLGGLGPWEVIVILIVALLLFGHRLPDIARSAGKAVVEFKRGMRDIEEDVNKAAKDDKDEKKDEKKDEEKKA